MRDRDPGEYLVKGNILANLFRGMEGVGGKIDITNERVIFKAHSLNFQREPLEIRISEIQHVGKRSTWGIIPNGMEIATRKGETYKFVLYNRGNVIKTINELRNA
ncbi:hypothetical protein CDO73_12220 [Saccharibacillus sp. O23]|uniref:GRAM domain-containing protein n=1 Tax=Saccharibacillus sp. O23 TaxID=2009338 RepID=UPI000B4E54FF|nr:GRAM domain-containing protein [Saccharibacillus sp. O23]OWR29846.1 hypothetical protein CDO73_12220 [Saccharibacillus sp. O23]